MVKTPIKTPYKIFEKPRMFGALVDFFSPDDTKLKIECKTQVFRDEFGNLKIRRSFYTFRSLYTHIKWATVQQPYEKAKKVLENMQENPAYAVRFAGAFAVFILIAVSEIKNINNFVLVAGAIAYDTDTDRTNETGGSTTFSHTCSGSNRALTLSAASYRVLSSATYAAVSMTLGANASVGQAKSGVYYLGNPASGANNVVFTPTSSGTDQLCAISFTGANSAAPQGQTATQTATNSDTISQNITTLYANSFLVDCIATEEDNAHVYGANGGQTGRMWGQNNFWIGGGASTKPTTTTGSYSMGWAKSSGAQANNISLSVQEIRELGSVDVTVNATVVTATFSIPAVTVTAVRNVSTSVSPQTATFSIPTVSVRIDVSVAPSPQVATFSLPAPNITTDGNVTVSASVVTATFSTPAPTISVVSNMTVSASVVTATFSLPTPTITAEQNTIISPLAQTATFSLPAPTITVERSVTVSPSAVVATFSLPTPNVYDEQIVSASVVTATFSIPTPTITAIRNVTISASVVVATFSLPRPRKTGGIWTPQPRDEGVWTPTARVAT